MRKSKEKRRRRGGEEKGRREGEERRREEKSLTKGSKSENMRKKPKDSPDRQKCKNWRGGGERSH